MQTAALLDAKTDETTMTGFLSLKADAANVYTKVEIAQKIAGKAYLDEVFNLYQSTTAVGGHVKYLAVTLASQINAKAHPNFVATSLTALQSNIEATRDYFDVQAPLSLVLNPLDHASITLGVSSLTAGMVGLASVSNLSDADRPLSAAMAAALSGELSVGSFTNSGIGLGNVDNASDLLMPRSTSMHNALNSKLCISSFTKSSTGFGNVGNTFDLLKPVSASTQCALNSKFHISCLTNSGLGLGNVDNTSDLLKPTSTSTQRALNSELDISSLRTPVFV